MTKRRLHVPGQQRIDQICHLTDFADPIGQAFVVEDGQGNREIHQYGGDPHIMRMARAIVSAELSTLDPGEVVDPETFSDWVVDLADRIVSKCKQRLTSGEDAEGGETSDGE